MSKKYFVVFKEKELIVFDEIELTPNQLKKFKRDPNLMSIKPIKEVKNNDKETD